MARVIQTKSDLISAYGQGRYQEDGALSTRNVGAPASMFKTLDNVMRSTKMIRALTSLVNTDCLIGWIFQMNIRPWGTESQWAVLTQLNEGGLALDELSLLPPAQAPDGIKPSVRVATRAQGFQVSELALRMNPRVNVGSWAGTMAYNIKALRDGWTLNEAAQIWNSPDSVLAKTYTGTAVGATKIYVKSLYGIDDGGAGGANPIVTLDEVYPVFRPGMPILMQNGSSVDKMATGIIKAVNQDSKGPYLLLTKAITNNTALDDGATITKWSGAEISATATDADIKKETETGKGLVGITEGFKTTGKYYGIDVADNPIFSGHSEELADPTATESVDQDDLQRFFDRAEIYSGDDGGSPSIMVSSLPARRLYLKTFQDQKRYVNLNLKGGFTALDYNGMKWTADKRCPLQHIYRLALNNYVTAQVAAPDWLSRDTPTIFRQAGGRPAWVAHLWEAKQLINKRPNSQFRLTNVRPFIA